MSPFVALVEGGWYMMTRHFLSLPSNPTHSVVARNGRSSSILTCHTNCYLKNLNIALIVDIDELSKVGMSLVTQINTFLSHTLMRCFLVFPILKSTSNTYSFVSYVLQRNRKFRHTYQMFQSTDQPLKVKCKVKKRMLVTFLKEVSKIVAPIILWGLFFLP